MALQRFVWSRYTLHDPANQYIRRDAFGERLVGQHETVAKYIGDQVLDVFGQHVSAAA